MLTAFVIVGSYTQLINSYLDFHLLCKQNSSFQILRKNTGLTLTQKLKLRGGGVGFRSYGNRGSHGNDYETKKIFKLMMNLITSHL